MSLNSTMVRLKRDKIEVKMRKSSKSQFHYGSIKTQDEAFEETNDKGCLNSTMVRLKLFSYKLYSRYDFESQFHYGSIKTILINLSNHPSTKWSQFHYGSIKTVQWEVMKTIFTCVSIPLWFD